ncbi:M24 family metallopeptidase [Radiobacillus sp. PE A8.2]|uniref:M24 family metallopeptidase n=1 Tax=Radiobacillus sp. PE A8.2 TaxID=3380349 RepID=UPI00388D4766
MQLGDPKIAAEKIAQAVQLMKAENIDTWLILTREGTDPALPLLVGVRSVHQAAIFLRSDNKHIVLTSVSDKGSYQDTNLFNEVITYEASMDDAFRAVFEQLAVKKLALNISESDHLCDGLTAGLYQWLTDVVGAEVLTSMEVSSQLILKRLRSIKSPTEVALVKKAVELTVEVYEAVFNQIVCGMTEKEIGLLFVEEMKKRGVSNGLGNPFDPPLVCTVRNGLAHRKPGDFKTIPGDIIIIDFSLKYQNYVSDIARTCYILKPGEEKAPDSIQHAFDTAITAITASIKALKPGAKGFEVDAVGRRQIELNDYPTIRHSVGHQIGRATHDGGTILGPLRTPKRPEVEGVIEAGEIYAVEPTVIQDDGLPCILVEENVLVTDHKPVILSKRQTEIVLISS